MSGRGQAHYGGKIRPIPLVQWAWTEYAILPDMVTHFLKQVRLIPPEEAGNAGVPAEAPVFISPFITDAQRCAQCRVIFTPLVYQTGYDTYGQHWHEEAGGIYFHVKHSLRWRIGLLKRTGWVASVHPLGRVLLQESGVDGPGRAEAVRCGGISACYMCEIMTINKLLRQPHSRHVIDGGVLVVYSPSTGGDPPMLLPVCDQADLSPRQAPLRFHITDGEVFYAQRDVP